MRAITESRKRCQKVVYYGALRRAEGMEGKGGTTAEGWYTHAPGARPVPEPKALA